jgi:hypothetical protein
MLFKKLNDNELERAAFLLYSEKVRRMTEKTFKREFVENRDLRGKGWHLDHKLSIKECFLNEVPPEMAAHICNLEMTPQEYNAKKGAKSTITFGELIEMVTEYDEYDD